MTTPVPKGEGEMFCVLSVLCVSEGSVPTKKNAP